VKVLSIALVVLVAARLHVTVWFAGVPYSVPVLLYAALTIGVPLALVLIAGRHVLACNWPRICWSAA
jgi:hypothetical protein